MSLSLISRIHSCPARPLSCDCGPDDIAALQGIIGEIGDQLIALKGGITKLIAEVPRLDRVKMVARLEELLRDAAD